MFCLNAVSPLLVYLFNNVWVGAFWGVFEVVVGSVFRVIVGRFSPDGPRGGGRIKITCLFILCYAQFYFLFALYGVKFALYYLL